MAASSSGLLLRDMPGGDDPLGLSVSAGPAKRLRSLPSACSTPGPSSYEALLNWGHRCVEQVEGKLWLTTFYSGAGTVEHVLSCIWKEMGLPVASLVFWSMADSSEVCRSLALNSKNPPMHVFGGIMDRVPLRIMKKLYLIQQTTLKLPLRKGPSMERRAGFSWTSLELGAAGSC